MRRGPRRAFPVALVLACAAAVLLTACDDGREVANPFAGPSYGPRQHTLPQGPVPWRDAPQPP